jgi:hypothetical protein
MKGPTEGNEGSVTNEESVRYQTLNLLGTRSPESPEIECYLTFEHIRAKTSRWTPDMRAMLLELMQDAEAVDRARRAGAIRPQLRSVN